MVAEVLAADRDVGIRTGYFVGDVHGFDVVVRWFPFVGFVGDWAWGIRDRKKRGEGDREFVVKEMEVKCQAMEIIENLLFGENVKYLQCSKCKVRLPRVDTIVLHGTVGAGAISSALYLCRPDTGVSAHVVIGRDAEVFQLLPFDVKAWHAGKSFHAGRVNLNDCSIGIELDNAGELQRVGDRYYSSFGREYSPDQVYTIEDGGRARYWHSFTEGQFTVVEEICRLLKACYGIKYLVRHSDITSRKIDPGPAFPFGELKQRLKFY